jgi:mono/diheme cytochrome c family protein
MKKTLSIITLSVLVWGCAHKIAPVAGGGTSNAGAPATTAAATTTSGSATAAATDEKTTAKTPVADATKPAAAATPEMLGQTTFNAKCGRCHGLKPTSDYTADRWASIMQVMAMKAQLNDTEKSNVLAYVRANAKK